MTVSDCDVPVMIVGGGPVGLVSSILLSQRGIEHVLVEARRATSTHPKARGVSARSMEILRRIGVEEHVRRAGLPREHVSMFRGRSLTDPDSVRTSVTANGGDRPAITPSPGVVCAQDVLEAVLARTAGDLGAGPIRFGQTLVSLRRHGDGVRSQIRDDRTDRVWHVESRYVVGCDGAGSTVRQRCGIPMEGRTGLGHFASVRFRAPLADVVSDRASTSYFLIPPSRGGFMAIDNQSHWIYQYPFDPTAEHPATFDEQTWVELIRAGAGVDELDVEVLDIAEWRMDACLAGAYRADRVLLAGDAAHLVPPTGGHGMNLGIGDADNLAWKLAAVLSGEAGDALLDSYSAERRPIAAQVIAVATGNAHARDGYRIDDDLLLSTTYASTAVASTGSAAGSRIAVTTDDELIDLMWADRPPANAVGALRVTVSRLRTALGEPFHEVLLRRATGYQLAVSPLQVDRSSFARAIDDGRAALAAGDVDCAERRLRSALAAWRGTPWQDLGDRPSLAGPRATLIELHDVAFEDLQEARLANGDAATAVAALSAAVSTRRTSNAGGSCWRSGCIERDGRPRRWPNCVLCADFSTTNSASFRVAPCGTWSCASCVTTPR